MGLISCAAIEGGDDAIALVLALVSGCRRLLQNAPTQEPPSAAALTFQGVYCDSCLGLPSTGYTWVTWNCITAAPGSCPGGCAGKTSPATMY